MKKEEFYREARRDVTGPLQGVRVLEATTAGAGPWAGTLLADMGADIIKVDQPGAGDMARKLPPFVKDENRQETGGLHLSINRNKKNITLKLSSPEGAELFRQLASKMDIVIQNFKPGTMSKWGVGYEDIRRVKPDIIYASISGFGQFGPLHERAGYDGVGQAMGGLMHITGYPDGPPTKTGNAMADNITGWLGAFSCVSALYWRQQTGEGQHLDVSLLDTILYVSEVGILGAASANFNWKRMGRHPAAPRAVHRCGDGNYLYLMCVLDQHWAKLCHLMNRPDLITDPRTSTTPDRAANHEVCEAAIEAWVSTKSADEVVDLTNQQGLVCAPVLDFSQIIRNEHILERDMVADVEHPVAGPIKIYGVGPKLSRTPTRVRMPAPTLGQHNAEVYGHLLALDEVRMDQLKEQGII